MPLRISKPKPPRIKLPPIKKPKKPKPLSRFEKEIAKRTKNFSKSKVKLVDKIASSAPIKLPKDSKKEAQSQANKFADRYKVEKDNKGDFDDCVVVVAAACAAVGAAYGGVAGAALGAGAGVPAARLACRRVFPQKDGN